MDVIKTLIRKRGAVKAKITKSFNNYDNPKDEAVSLTPVTLKNFINAKLQEIEKFDDDIVEQYNMLLDKKTDPTELSEVQERIDQELDDQTDYALLVKSKLEPLSENKDVTNCSLKLPELKCDYFTGEGATNLEYYAFITKFNNVVGLRTNLSDSTKMTYLKTYLKGYAFKLVQHLQVTDKNYREALKLLEVEFLNTDALVDDLFKKLLDLKPKFDNNYLGTKLFISEVRCIISDLNNYECDLLQDGSSYSFVSHIIFNKLPFIFKQELVRKCNNNYPTLQEICDNYNDVIKTLLIRQNNQPSKFVKSDSVQQQNASENHKPYNSGIKQYCVTNSKSNHPEPRKNCKFCSSTGHSMMKCNKYPNYESRVNRCKSLKMCIRCSSFKHKENECNSTLDYECFTCKTKEHISAMCPKLLPIQVHSCISMSHSGGRTFVLPTVCVKLTHGNTSTEVRCLIDTGSQRSYVSADILNRLDIKDKIEKTDCMISTFIDNSYKSMSELCFPFNVNGSRAVLPFFIDYDFKLSYTIDGLSKAHDNISKTFTLADKLNNDYVELGGLLGVDALQYLPKMNIVSCLGGSAFELSDGSMVPFGNVDNFLSYKELFNKYDGSQGALTIEDEPKFMNSITNLVINPVPTCFDPISDVIQESAVEGKLDRFFNLDSLGIKQEQSEYDVKQVEAFDSAISLENGKYFVDIPWNDKISDVKTNFGVCKSILTKVHDNLVNNKLYEQYNDVLKQQLQDGILEEVPIEPSQPNHVYIPHRPVVKTDDSVTTKCRIVLNCSLKIGETPSLNEACYPGVNLLNDLFSLLIKTRADNYIMISDVKQAFLMIRLKSETDKNRFRILWFDENNKLISYRYTSIVFGHVASPFILNHVMDHHLKQYERDYCFDVLSNNKYVDNIFATNNDPQVLADLCDVSRSRLSEGGFELRSWASNSTHLKDKFSLNEIQSKNIDDEKLLGYNYSTMNDNISLPPNQDYPTDELITKRKILSATAQVFDPLGLHNPVTVRGKILLQKVWANKFDWDEPLPLDIVEEFKSLQDDIKLLHNIKFPRKAYGDNISLIIFTDASKTTYGFACYARSVEGDQIETRLLFSKCKNAPSKSKSIPTLELLAVFMALKCLPSILDALSGKNILDIFIGVDAQIVLSWILTKNVRAKNIFAANRVKDISIFRDDISEKYKIDCRFKYIPSELNVADLVTKGLSMKHFLGRLEVWQHGPAFLSTADIKWPERALGCLSNSSKALTCNVSMVVQPKLLDYKRFSDFNKLCRVTMLVFKFIDKLKKKSTDTLELMRLAKIHLIKTEQNVHFSEDLLYLDGKVTTCVPSRVKNLDLFIDDYGLLRSKGRLGKCSTINYDINNPILLPKESYVTQLIIWDCHKKCKHMGSGTTMTTIRNGGFWIPKGRNLIKSVLHKCIVCKKLNAHAFKYPKPNDYPKEKVTFQSPYQHTGMDFTGHVYVKIGNETVKMYILVFTCLNIRSIHLELVPSMNSTHFLQAFIRFCNLYCIPETVFSDNASTFMHSMKLIGDCQVNDDFEQYLVKNNVKHITIPVYSAWQGSSWERMIRTIKSSLYKLIGRKHTEYFEMITLLSDVQNAINSRPLCYFDNDDNNYSVISPNMFLKFDTGRSMVFGSVVENNVRHASSEQLIDAMVRRDTMFEGFRELWFDEYLTSLREAGRDRFQGNWVNTISKNDIVLVSNPTKPRAQWNLGRITELLYGNDGRVRTVRVMRPDRSEAVYSINLLYPLELSVTPVIDNGSKHQQTECSKVEPSQTPRPKRAAAMRCLQRLRACD